MHGGREVYYVVNREGCVEEPPDADDAGTVRTTRLKFGRLFDRRAESSPPDDPAAMNQKLTELGECMNDPTTCDGRAADGPADESDIPAGYTYLGQFLAHEITFDDSNDTFDPHIDPRNLRTPQIDFDGLYGGAEAPSHGKYLYRDLYEDDGVCLKVGETSRVTPPGETFPHDLPRVRDHLKRDPKDPARDAAIDAVVKENPKLALLGDERNDENLALAQTHVAFLRFHNRVVEQLRAEKHPEAGLFECARRQVVRHFQWVVLYDYLPRLVDAGVLERVLDEKAGPSLFEGRAVDAQGPKMPLEFAAAAFRIGHTMVRASYEWNRYHSSQNDFGGRPASVLKLFQLTGARRPRGEQFDEAVDGFSTGMTRPANVAGLLTLPSDWVIDWRRFYEFPQSGGDPRPRVNRASKLDTTLNFQLDKLQSIPGAKRDRAKEMIRAITVRNLRRGYCNGLPTGEEVAARLTEKGLLKRGEALDPDQTAEGPHEAVLRDPLLYGKTPLWYYVLKEAKLLGKGRDGTGGHRLGPVGSTIVAETLVGLVRHSPCSILKDRGWRPTYGRAARGGGRPQFEMTDLLDFALDGKVNPLG